MATWYIHGIMKYWCDNLLVRHLEVDLFTITRGNSILALSCMCRAGLNLLIFLRALAFCQNYMQQQSTSHEKCRSAGKIPPSGFAMKFS